VKSLGQLKIVKSSPVHLPCGVCQ